jgi:hypothetical protein
MEANVTNGVTPLLVGVAMALATGASVALTPIHRPNEDVAFLERVAVTVERATVIAPDTRDYLSELTNRHRSALADGALDFRRQKALERITAATQPASRLEPARLGTRDVAK